MLLKHTVNNLSKLTLKHSHPPGTYPFCGGFLHTQHLDALGQVKLVVLEVSAEEGGLGAGVRERDPHVTDHRCLVLLHAQLGGALLEHHLRHSRTPGQRRTRFTMYSCRRHWEFKEGGSGGEGSRFNHSGLDCQIVRLLHGHVKAFFFTPGRTWPHNHKKLHCRM